MSSCESMDGPRRYDLARYARLGAVSPPPPGCRARCWPPTPAARAPLPAPPINSAGIIRCAHADGRAAGQSPASSHVLHSAQCLLSLKRCAREPAALDRLPRFRFGGNRASTKRAGEQRLRDLTERLGRRPAPPPPPRARHSLRAPDEEGGRAPARSASFSTGDNKCARAGEPAPDDGPSAATLPRSKPPRSGRDPSTQRNFVPYGIEKESSRVCWDQPIPDIVQHDSTPPPTENLNELFDMINRNNPDKEFDTTHPIVRSNTISSGNPSTQEKKRDKSRRRKGIYISQWPDHTSEDVIRFDETDFSTPDKTKQFQESIAEIGKLKIDEQRWSNEEDSASLRDKNPMLLRADSISEGEPDEAHHSLVPSDVSDCESRISAGADPTSPRRYSKRPLRGPYGQMLEAEMKKPEIGRKNLNTDLKFLEDWSRAGEAKGKHARTRGSCNSSLDETHSKGSSCTSLLGSPKQMPLSKRKVSADSLVVENEQRLVVSHQRTTSSPSKLEGSNNVEVSHVLLEQLLRGSSEQLASADTNLQQKNDTRTHVVVELYDNEKTYVESLQILVTKYLEPLKNPDNSLLDLTLVDEIFYQIPFLLTHHQIFLDEMKKRLEQWDLKQKIGDVFLEMFSKSAVIESYTSYVNNCKRARDIIKNAQQSKPAFAKFLETTAREHKGKLALDSLLIKPVQKFPKYELLLQRLIQHTDVSHPDHSLLLAAQKEVRDKLLKINCTEREALELEQLREIESLIEGLEELVASDRHYLRHDLVTMSAGGGARKERALFLFSDLLLVTSIKRRSGTMRRPVPGQGSVTSTLEANKYKLLMKIALDNLEIVRSKDDNLRQMMVEIENLSGDVKLLNQINELSWSLHSSHSQLDELIRDMLSSLNKQLMEQQNSDSQLSCLDLTLNTLSGLEIISVVFSKPEKRSTWEESFSEAKHKLALASDRKTCPELLATVPIRKTRSGLQFTCAAPTLGDTGKDVWVCNSDGYVGQVCILSLQPEPTVTSCNGVCNSRILCIASVPAITNSSSDEQSSNSREQNEEHKTIQFDSSSSSEEDDRSDEEIDEPEKPDLDEASVDLEDIDSNQSTIWLGTEDGCIHVYNSSDNIRIKKNKIKLQHGSSILCIIYLENRVFISLANGDMTIYDRDNYGGWNISTPTTVTVGSSSTPVLKMLPNASKLWCGCGSTIKVFNTQTLQTEHNFTINNDSNKAVSCIVLYGYGLWLALQNSAIVKCFHTTNFEYLCEVNVAPAVTKMLTSCDDIIRQHKAACLRVTSLLACKDLLWIGTSAGVLLTMSLPHISAATSKLSGVPTVNGVSHGHTGHVRFLTCVELTPDQTAEQKHRNSYKAKQEPRNCSKLLVISGGDGYEDFRSSNLSEVAGREDSTNHLLLWNI